MSDENDRLQARHESKARVRQQREKFQEAPGEADADTARDAFLKSAGPAPERLASALAATDGGLRSSAVSRLQQERGNQYVQRVVEEAHGTPGRLVGLSQPEMVDEVRGRAGGGSPLPESVRQEMEGFFGAGLDDVRVHTDGEAAALSRELGAQAFTVGRNVFFAEGKYNPGSREGQALLAHELTHVGQQAGFEAPAAQRQSEEEEEKVQTALAPEELEAEGKPEEKPKPEEEFAPAKEKPPAKPEEKPEEEEKPGA
jgi:hypothetical protein